MDHSMTTGAHDTEELRHAIDHVAAPLAGKTRMIASHLSSGKLLRGRLVMAVAALADDERRSVGASVEDGQLVQFAEDVTDAARC